MKVSGKIFLFVLIASGFFTQYSGATVYHSNGTVANVQALHDYYARDGDTITLPPGRFSWTRSLLLNKAVTLKGLTTISGAGTKRAAANDVSIILDNLPNRPNFNPLVSMQTGAGKRIRITGLTFNRGDSTVENAVACIAVTGNSGVSAARIDNCHFNKLAQQRVIRNFGWAYGVADHNLIEVPGNDWPFVFNQDTTGGGSNVHGDGAWADYPWYGTDKFFFAETNTILRVGTTAAASLADADLGARYVIRHNYVLNCIPSNHGTQVRGRGTRAVEVYDNIFEITSSFGGGGSRSGTMMWHDNGFILAKGDPVHRQCCNFGNFREFADQGTTGFGMALGDNPWDMNDTEGNGTFVEGHAPHLFESGTVTSPATVVGNVVKVSDATKNWTPNQWTRYSIKSLVNGIGSQIISNTATEISFYPEIHGFFPRLAVGDTYQIHRVLRSMDSGGTGKGDKVRGDPPVNSTTGTISWIHQALEPCFSWNNTVVSTGTALGFGPSTPGQPCTRANVEFFNLGSGFAANTTPAQVSSTYTAALNGVDYTGPFVYPHPLTLLPTGTARAFVADFNGAGRPDYVLQTPNTRQTAIWYLNNNVVVGGAYGPTLPPAWNLVGVADFNRDGHPDYALFNSSNGQTAIWYLSGPTFIGGVYGPALPSGWGLVATADFNGDSKPDYLLYNGSTRQTAIWYLNNNVVVGGAYGPTLPPGWNLVGVADFNRDGHPDYLLFNSITRQTAIWYLSGPTFLGGAYGPTLPSVWLFVAAADFNGDSQPDYLLYNVNTQQTAIWYLNNNVFVGGAYGPTLPAGWSFFGP